MDRWMFTTPGSRFRENRDAQMMGFLRRESHARGGGVDA